MRTQPFDQKERLMKMDQFIARLAEQGPFEGRGDARDAAQATLIALSERITGGEASDLSAQLSGDLGEWAASAAGSGGISVDADEFCSMVAERASTIATPEEAKASTRAVLGMLREAVTDGQYADLRAQLPDAWEGELLPA